jgi:hypothetical protein
MRSLLICLVVIFLQIFVDAKGRGSSSRSSSSRSSSSRSSSSRSSDSDWVDADGNGILDCNPCDKLKDGATPMDEFYYQKDNDDCRPRPKTGQEDEWTYCENLAVVIDCPEDCDYEDRVIEDQTAFACLKNGDECKRFKDGGCSRDSGPCFSAYAADVVRNEAAAPDCLPCSRFRKHASSEDAFFCQKNNRKCYFYEGEGVCNKRNTFLCRNPISSPTCSECEDYRDGATSTDTYFCQDSRGRCSFFDENEGCDDQCINLNGDPAVYNELIFTLSEEEDELEEQCGEECVPELPAEEAFFVPFFPDSPTFVDPNDDRFICQGVEDECGVCDGNGIPAGECDCDGNVEDVCGVCDGDGSSCVDCAGVANGNAQMLACGCNDADSCNDCAGVPNGNAEVLACGCNDADSCDDCAGVPNGYAEVLA